MAEKPKMSVEEAPTPQDAATIQDDQSPRAQAQPGQGTRCVSRAGGWQAFTRWLQALTQGHRNAWIGGACGFLIALLFLTIGFWPTFLLLVCVLVGVLIGQALDGNPKILKILRQMFSDNR